MLLALPIPKQENQNADLGLLFSCVFAAISHCFPDDNKAALPQVCRRGEGLTAGHLIQKPASKLQMLEALAGHTSLVIWVLQLLASEGGPSLERSSVYTSATLNRRPVFLKSFNTAV